MQPFLRYSVVVLLLAIVAGCMSSLPVPKPMVATPASKEASVFSLPLASTMARSLQTNTIVFRYATNLVLCNYVWTLEYKTNLFGTWFSFTNLYASNISGIDDAHCQYEISVAASNINARMFFVRAKGTPK